MLGLPSSMVGAMCLMRLIWGMGRRRVTWGQRVRHAWRGALSHWFDLACACRSLAALARRMPRRMRRVTPLVELAAFPSETSPPRGRSGEWKKRNTEDLHLLFQAAEEWA